MRRQASLTSLALVLAAAVGFAPAPSNGAASGPRPAGVAPGGCFRALQHPGQPQRRRGRRCRRPHGPRRERTESLERGAQALSPLRLETVPAPARPPAMPPRKVADDPTPAAPPATGIGTGSPFRFYSPTSFWNLAVAAEAPLDPDSDAIVAALDSLVASEQRLGTGPAINTTAYSVPIYTVAADQATVRVTLDNGSAPALQEAWSAVPIPDGARPAAGTDGTLVIWQPSSDTLWDLWRAERRADGWHASWGGATRNVSSSSSIPGPESWPGAKSSWGTSGASIGVVGGLITLEELSLGKIDHALQMAIPNVRAGVYAWPAQRTDGRSSDPLALPEGAHLRLDPELDLQRLHLPRLTLTIAEAAQRYGIIVNNAAANVAFYAEDPTRTGSDPYRGPGGYFEGSYPRQLLARFPWADLQLLKMELSEG